ncbi:hypothetical protein BFJ68_g15978 [Fusarium oxysporum]|uniref:Uncharacterized protein n=1 Tax=Fusarium oxysporum TaxID=5507 RepID=A0A420PI40_FUSOX|nr:hypothetical protein BFJ71_g15577 [Fusarium oxysporum]RKK92174.1 hypothetical protein BFJ68_g15978 [Fusarium oxysporum]
MWANTRWLNLSQSVAVALAKVRVLMDLHAIQNATRALRGIVPREIIGSVRHQFVGTIMESRLEIVTGDIEETTRLIQTIESRLRELYRSIDQYNPRFWPSMFNDPAGVIATRTVAYSDLPKF